MTLPRWITVLLVLILTPGCDVDFVAVEDDPDPSGFISVRSEHNDVLETSVDIRLPEQGSMPTVALGSMELPGAREGNRWRFSATVRVDTIRPELHITIQTTQRLEIDLPLLARHGAAIRLQDGGLELPLIHGANGAAPAAETTWQLVLRDSEGNALMQLTASSGSPPPTPLVLPRELVRADAAYSEVSVTSRREIMEGPYPLSVFSSGDVRISIPTN